MSPRVNEIVFRHLIAYMRFATHAICECMIFMAIGYGMAIGGKAAQHGTQPARTETIPAFATCRDRDIRINVKSVRRR